MSVVNLNKLRKAKARDQDRALADANAAKFGLTKTQKSLAKAKAEKTSRDLDSAKRE